MNQPSDANSKTTPLPDRGGTWWTGGQLVFLGIILAVPLLLFLFTAIATPDYISLLWRHPMGIKMSLGALALVIIGTVAYLGLGLAINRWVPPRDPNRRTARSFILLFVNIVFTIYSFLPVFFVVLVGSAAINIAEKTTAPGP